MARIIVSLVSEQTIPNVFFIKEMETEQSKADCLVFITTAEMEKRKITDSILKALGTEYAHGVQMVKKQVIEDNLLDIGEKLGELRFADKDDILVNLTCGTKLMSIGTYSFFSALGARIYYLPLAANIYKPIYPVRSNSQYPVRFRIDLRSYLYAYGLELSGPWHYTPLHSAVEAERMLRLYVDKRHQKVVHDLRSRVNRKQKKALRLDLVKGLDTLVQEVGMESRRAGLFPAISAWDGHWLCGAWFEELVCHWLLEYRAIGREALALGVYLKRGQVKNEFDLMLLHQNALTVIECKTSLSVNKKSIMTDALYKLDSLYRKLGLRTTSWLVTLDDVAAHDADGSKRERAEHMGIRLADRSILLDEGRRRKEFLKRVFDG